MGMSMGTVLEWYKAVGDSVALDEDLVEVEAEKTTDIVLSPAAGVIVEIIAQVGDEKSVGDVLAMIEVEE